MATVNLGSIKFKWKGTYSGATAYTIDDVVSYNGSSYICILASTGNLPTNATYFEQMSSAGTNGTDLTTTLTTQGDLVYRDGSGLVRLGAGTAGQVLQTGGAAANPSWTDLSSSGGILQTVSATDAVTITTTSNTYTTAGNTLSLTLTPASTSSKVLVTFAFNGGNTNTSNRAFYTIFRDIGGTKTNLAPNGNSMATHELGGSGYMTENFMTLSYLDSPNTTSSVTYTVEAYTKGTSTTYLGEIGRAD